jgi:hypothetical protein
VRVYSFLYAFACLGIAVFSLTRLVMDYISPPHAAWCLPIERTSTGSSFYDDDAGDGCMYGEELVDLVDVVSLVSYYLV